MEAFILDDLFSRVRPLFLAVKLSFSCEMKKNSGFTAGKSESSCELEKNVGFTAGNRKTSCEMKNFC